MKLKELKENKTVVSPLTVFGKKLPNQKHNYVLQKKGFNSFEGIPEEVEGDFYLGGNKFESLEGIHKHIKRVYGEIFFNNTPIKSHVLGLLKIKDLFRVILDNQEVQNIINKHIRNGRDVLACQNELIDAGFEDFAQL